MHSMIFSSAIFDTLASMKHHCLYLQMRFTRSTLPAALLVKRVTICNTSGISVIEIYIIRTLVTFDGLIKL